MNWTVKKDRDIISYHDGITEFVAQNEQGLFVLFRWAGGPESNRLYSSDVPSIGGLSQATPFYVYESDISFV